MSYNLSTDKPQPVDLFSSVSIPKVFKALKDGKKTLDEILAIDNKRSHDIVKSVMKLIKIQPNIFKVIEFIKTSPDYTTCDEKMLAVYAASVGQVINACK